jgi:hypothetical protein
VDLVSNRLGRFYNGRVDRGHLRITLLTRVARALCAGVVLAMALASPAAATPFGLPLGTAPFTSAPSYPYDCRVVVAFGMVEPLFPGATSCIWGDVPSPAETQAFGGQNISLEPPGTGTVTDVRVGVGPTTGPMQIVVMRALYSNTVTPGHPNDACCFPVARSQPFTPQANAITTIPVNLPVREDPTPPPEDITTIADFDTIGLAVLAPGVPIPLYYTGDSSQPADFVWNTSTPSTITPGFSTDTGGFFVALGGEWTPGGGGGGTPGGGGGGTPGLGGGVPLGLVNPTEPVRGGNADVGLRCAASAACIGRLLLQSGPARGAVIAPAGDAAALSAASKLVTYGSSTFRIAAHGHRVIVVHLSPSAKRLVAKHHSTRAWANLVLYGGALRSYAFRVTLHH